MAYPTTTAAQVLDQLAARFHQTGGGTSLPDDYAVVARDALAQAAADIRMILCGKGYLPADVEAWDDGGTYVLRLAVFYALTDVRVLRNYPGLDEKALDPREMLSNLGFLIVGGLPVAPTANASPVGGICHGCSTAARRAVERYEHQTKGYGRHEPRCD